MNCWLDVLATQDSCSHFFFTFCCFWWHDTKICTCRRFPSSLPLVDCLFKCPEAQRSGRIMQPNQQTESSVSLVCQATGNWKWVHTIWKLTDRKPLQLCGMMRRLIPKLRPIIKNERGNIQLQNCIVLKAASYSTFCSMVPINEYKIDMYCIILEWICFFILSSQIYISV